MTWVHSWSPNSLIMSYPGPARLCGELRIGVHSTASTGGTAGEVGTVQRCWNPLVKDHYQIHIWSDPTNQESIPALGPQDLRGFEGDAASNPGIKALYVEGFSEASCGVDSCNRERDCKTGAVGLSFLSWDLMIKHDLGIPHFHKARPKVLGRPHTFDFIPNFKWQGMLDLNEYEPKLRTQCKPIPRISNATPIPNWHWEILRTHHEIVETEQHQDICSRL